MGVIESQQPTTPAVFDVAVRDVAQRVRTSLAEVLAVIGVDATKPQSMARQLGLDKSLAWKTSRIVSDADPFAAIPRLPGRSGQKILINSLRTAGAPADAIGAVQEAMDEFERLVETHAGDRETFEMMLSGLGKDGQSDLDEAHRKLSFQGNSAIWGVQARVQMVSQFVAPGEGSKLSLSTVYGLIDFRRLRTSAAWGVASMWGYHDDGTTTKESHEPLDRTSLTEGGLPLLTSFSSQNLPPMRVSWSRNGLKRYEIVEGPVGMTGAMNIVSGWVSHNTVDRYRTPVDKVGEHLVYLSTPVELLVHDLFVHKSLDFAMRPKAHLYSQLPGGPVYPMDGRESGQLPLPEAMVDLGEGPPDLTTPEIGRYRAMADMGAKGVGFGMNDFHGFRLKIKYPPIPTLTLYRYDLPEKA